MLVLAQPIGDPGGSPRDQKRSPGVRSVIGGGPAATISAQLALTSETCELYREKLRANRGCGVDPQSIIRKQFSQSAITLRRFRCSREHLVPALAIKRILKREPLFECGDELFPVVR